MSLSRRAFFSKGATAAAAASISNLLIFPEPTFSASAAQAPPALQNRMFPKNAVLLNSNENAFGPFASAKAAMQEAIGIVHRYPDNEFDELWEALVKLHGVKPEQVVERPIDFAFQRDAPAFDAQLGLDGLHRVRPQVKPQQRRTILPPDLFARYAQLSFWRDLKDSKAFRIVVQGGAEKQRDTMPGSEPAITPEAAS